MIETAYGEGSNTIKVIPFKDSIIGKSPNTRVILNPRYSEQIPTLDALDGYLYLPSVLSEETITFHVPDSVYNREREVGNTEKLFILQEKDGYKRIGVISLKAVGVKEFSEGIAKRTERESVTFGIAESDEIMIDANMGDYLDQEQFSNVGNTLGMVSVSREDFLEHLRQVGYHTYASFLEGAGFLSPDKKGTPVVLLIRFTDPERFPDLGTNYFFEPDKQEEFCSFLYRSQQLLYEELHLNGKTAFMSRYGIASEEFIQHLINPPEENTESAKHHLGLLIYLIANNIFAVKKQNLYLDVDKRNIGNMGKLMDFAPSLDFYDVSDQMKLGRALVSLESIILDTSNVSMVFDTSLIERSVQASGLLHDIKVAVKYYRQFLQSNRITKVSIDLKDY